MTGVALGLTGLAAVLVGTLAVEVVRPFGVADVEISALVVPGPPSPVPGDVARVDLDAILVRPLFAPSRRAPAVASVPVDQVAVAETPRLTGVILAPGEGHAIFTLHGGKPVVVAEGGRIGDYVVKSIASDEVLLAGPDGQRMLRITADSRVRVKVHVLEAVDASGG